MYKPSHKSGFTIVELLIVIVVIGILAALALNSFTSAQVRARNTQTGSAVSAYRKALLNYAIEKGTYPGVGGCLGEGYPDINGDGSAGDCFIDTAPTKENTAFNNNLRPYMGNGTMPLGGLKAVNYGSANRSGIVFITQSGGSGVTLDGVAWPWWVFYVMEGASSKCTALPVASISWPAFYTSPPASGFTEGLSNGTGCWMPMPDPSKL